jgi:hypothetical protein
MRPIAPLLALALVALPASAAAPSVTVGEVTSSVVREGVDLNAMLRGVVEQELPGVDVGTRAKPTIVAFSLVSMDRTTADAKTQVSCVVSATVRDKRKGALVAVLEGRARAENEEKLVDLLERATLKSAVRGALSRLPEALTAAR